MSRTAQIDIDVIGPELYDVLIDNFTSARSVYVTLKDATYERLGKGRSKEDLVRDSVRFLLTKEPKEQILERFDIEDIKTYYPDFEEEIIKI